MNTQKFLNLLQKNLDKNLLFEYAPNMLVAPNYYLTEVKNSSINSVDCGTGKDSWKETIVQLWESREEKRKVNFMTCYKALAILKKVDNITPMIKTAEIKFEYGNSLFHTAHLFINEFHTINNNLIISLATYKTDCKAKEACGISEDSHEEIVGCFPSTGSC